MEKEISNTNVTESFENTGEQIVEEAETYIPIVRKKWQINIMMGIYFVGFVALLYFFNYVFGFMKGN